MPPPLIVDSHEDLAWNILTLGRDYRRSAGETRQAEAGQPAVLYNGDTLLGWPDYQRGRVAVIFATLFAAPLRFSHGEWDTQCYADFGQAQRLYREQLDAYQALVDRHSEKFRFIETNRQLQEVTSGWSTSTGSQAVGMVLLMEGAEGVRKPSELADWWEWGVRIIGPAWAGTRYCGGTLEPGPLTEDGLELLKGMAEFNYTLDLSHMDERAALQSLDAYPGPIIASHANAAALLEDYHGNRHLSNAAIHGIIGRGGVIGVIPFNRFLKPSWKTADGREGVTLATLANHIDHICQLAGSAAHVGIGSDFDGGFGLNSVPADVDTIADLQKLVPILTARGYTEADSSAVLGGNWLKFLQENLPSS